MLKLERATAPERTRQSRDPRDPGLYWIDGGDEPDIARWDADAQQWLLHGSNETLDDDQVTVLSETPLAFTPRPASLI